MSFVVRILGVPVFSVGFESPVDEQTQLRWIDGTGGQFELVTEDYSPDYDEDDVIEPAYPEGFGFRGQE